MFKTFLKQYGLYFLAWLTLVAFSVPGLFRLATGSPCYFQTSWLRCGKILSLGGKIEIFILITAILGCFVITGWHLWKRFKEPSLEKSNISWLFMIVPLLAVFVLPFGSSDTSYYFSVGRAFSEGTNAYVAPWVVTKDFGFPVSVNTITGFSYGPITALLFQGLYRLSGGNLLVFLLLWKVFLALVLIGSGLVMVKLLRFTEDSPRASSITLMFWIAQPMLLFEWVVNGHFDGLWLLTILGAIWAARAQKWWLVVPLLAVGTWIKFLPILVAPFFVLWWWQGLSQVTWKKYTLQMVVGLVVGLGITVLSWWPYWVGQSVFSSIVLHSKWAVISIFACVYYTLKPLAELIFGSNAHWYLTRAAQGGLGVVLVYLLYPLIKKGCLVLVRQLRLEEGEYIQMIFIFLLLYLMIWQKSFLPWYGAWFLPLSLLVYAQYRRAEVLRLGAWLSLSPFIYYVAWLANWFIRGADGGNELWFYYVMVLTVMAYPLYLLFVWRRKDYKAAYEVTQQN
jgi:hypothetical protein